VTAVTGDLGRNLQLVDMTDAKLPPLLKIRRTRRSLLKRLLLIGAAILCFITGIFGWLIPVVTGIPFYLAGLILLAMASPRVLEWINRAEARLSTKWRRRLRAGLAKVPIRKVRESVQQ
jgi:ABC-type uncharacterized transport system permease subunit